MIRRSQNRIFGFAAAEEKVEAAAPRVSSLAHFQDKRRLADEAADVFRAADLWYAIEDCSRNAERLSAVEEAIDARAGAGGIAGISVGGDRSVLKRCEAPVAVHSDAIIARVRREQADEFAQGDRYAASSALSIGRRTNRAASTFGAKHGRGTMRPRVPAAVALMRDPDAPPVGSLERAMRIVRCDVDAVRSMVALGSGDTPLHYAVRVGAPPALVALLLETGGSAALAKPNKVERNTPLHLAAHTLSAISTLEVLLRTREACCRAAAARNREGDTPLHIAARALSQGGVRADASGDARAVVVEWVRALTAACPAALRLRNNAGQLPLKIAADNHASRWLVELFSSFVQRNFAR
jgi:hypothetical protein